MDPELAKFLKNLPDEEVKRLMALYGGATYSKQVGAQMKKTAANVTVTLFWVIAAFVGMGLIGLLLLSVALAH
jgi:hypothetical protein